MSHHIPDTGKMASARDVLAASLWLLDREIAGAPLPAPSWDTYLENDPETAAIYETQAGCHLAALSAAGLVVVPKEPTDEMCEAARARHDADDRDADKYALYRSIGRAMIAAAFPAVPQEDSDDA